MTFSEVTSVLGVSGVTILDCSLNMYACGRQKAATDSSTDRFLSIDGKVGCLLNVFTYHTVDHCSSHTNMSVALSMVLNYGPVTVVTPT